MELDEYFKGCGVINKIKILTNKQTGHPKGFAYIEFEHVDAVELAMLLNETVFRQRQIKVTAKRTNIHGYLSSQSFTNRGRGRSVNSRHPRGNHANRSNRNTNVMNERVESINKSSPNEVGSPMKSPALMKPDVNTNNIQENDNPQRRQNRNPRYSNNRNRTKFRYNPY